MQLLRVRENGIPVNPKGRRCSQSIAGRRRGSIPTKTRAGGRIPQVPASRAGSVGFASSKSLDLRDGAFTEGDWIKPTYGVLQIAFKSACRGCRNLREVRKAKLLETLSAVGDIAARAERGRGRVRRVKNECFHSVSPLEFNFD